MGVSEKGSPFIELKKLNKFFKVGKNSYLHAVDDINITIGTGKTLGVVGESGCGKTTLGRTILKLIEPTSGEIIIEGVDIANFTQKQMRPYRKKMQIIFQDPYSSLNPRKTVFESIATPLKVNNETKNLKKKVDEVMDVCGLAKRLAYSYPHELDGGRRQRVCVARALVLEPEFILCDEPVSALDVSIQAQILNLLMDLQEERGLTFLFITHDLSVVRHISDEIMVMYLGKCVERSPSRELFNNPLHPYTKALLSAIPKPDISSRTKKIETVKGELSDPVNPVPGCRFYPRCQRRKDECIGKEIPLNEVSPGHFLACPVVEKEL